MRLRAAVRRTTSTIGASSSVSIDLATQAGAEGAEATSGWRPGIDGSWRICGVTQRLNGSEGAETTLELKEPRKGVGQNARKPAHE
jgi:hypothetical protein